MWGNFEHVQSYPFTVYDILFYQAQENGFELDTTTRPTYRRLGAKGSYLPLQRVSDKIL